MNKLVKADLTGKVLATWSSTTPLDDIALGDGYLWAVDKVGSAVVKIAGGATPLTMNSYPISGGVGPTAIAFDGQYMWTANWYGGSVSKIASDGTVVDTYPCSGCGPQAIMFDGTYMWTANRYGTISRFALDGTVTTYSVPGNHEGIALDQPGYGLVNLDPKMYIWVSSTDLGTVSKVDAGTGEIVATYPVGYAPRAIVFDGANIWVSFKGSIARIRAR